MNIIQYHASNSVICALSSITPSSVDSVLTNNIWTIFSLDPLLVLKESRYKIICDPIQQQRLLHILPQIQGQIYYFDKMYKRIHQDLPELQLPITDPKIPELQLETLMHKHEDAKELFPRLAQTVDIFMLETMSHADASVQAIRKYFKYRN